jgi:putative heme iron utilization protein
MFAFNIGRSLFLERRKRKLVLVRNDTDVPFVTADQPAINLKGTRPRPPENLSIYYPISPQLALLLADVGEEPMFPAQGLTAEQASALNRKVVEASHKQVFAQSRESLEGLL